MTWLLARDAASLWTRTLPVLGLWFCLGHAGNLLGQQVSTLLSTNRVAATLAFVGGTVVWVACLVLMVHSLERDLPAVRTNAAKVLQVGRRRLDVLRDGLGPFLAVFSLWGFVEEQWRGLFVANLATHGLQAELYSVNLSDWRLFAAFAAAAWLVRWGVRLVRTRRAARSLTFIEVLAEAVLVLAGFAVLFALGRLFWNWLTGRAVWQWLLFGREWLLGVLPAWPGLPEFLRDLLDGVAAVAPAAISTALLPLAWVSLVGVVFGLRDFTARGLTAGTRGETVAARLGDGEDLGGPAGRAWLWLTRDTREKYLTAAHGVRLIWARGPGLVGALIGLSAAFGLAVGWLDAGLERLIGPQSLAVTLGYQPALGTLIGFLATTGQVALYATAFDAGLAARPRVTAAR